MLLQDIVSGLFKAFLIGAIAVFALGYIQYHHFPVWDLKSDYGTQSTKESSSSFTVDGEKVKVSGNIRTVVIKEVIDGGEGYSVMSVKTTWEADCLKQTISVLELSVYENNKLDQTIEDGGIIPLEEANQNAINIYHKLCQS